MKESIYVTGSKGLVGSRFVELLGDKYDLVTPEIDRVDITDSNALTEYFKKKDISAIVNFAAYTNVSGGEGERGDKEKTCWRVNVDAVSNLINLAKEKNARLVQISTDMVFPGSSEDRGPFEETQNPEINSNKLTWYGYSKGEGERLVKEKMGGEAAILRLIYPVRARFSEKLDYLRKPLELFDQGKLYPMFNDQYISISFVDEIIKATEIIIDKRMVGIFHAGSTDITTPFKIVSYLLNKVRDVSGVVKPQSLDDFLKTVDNPVRYPKYGGLKVEVTENMLGIKYSSSEEIVDLLISQGLGK